MSQSVNRMNGGPAIRADSGMVATLHQHSAIHRGIMLDWLRHCDEKGELHPSNETIASRFDLPIEAARTLLADLADAGEIRITYARGERQITLAPTKPKRDIGTPRMLPASVRTPQKPRISEEECVARIKRIMARGNTAAPDAAIPAVQSADGNEGGYDVDRSAARAPGNSTGAAGPLEGRERGQRSAHQSPTRRPPVIAPEEAAVPAPAPPPVQRREEVAPARMVPITLSVYLPAALRAKVEAIYGAAPTGTFGRMLIEEAVAAREGQEPPVALTGKPTVPATVLRAANAAGADLHDFCSTLLRIGLAAYDRGER